MLLLAMLILTMSPCVVFSDRRTIEAIAQCRAGCLHEFFIAGSGFKCSTDKLCSMCWDTCQLIHNSAWERLCTAEPHWNAGCQKACSFKAMEFQKPIQSSKKPTAKRIKVIQSFHSANDSVSFQWIGTDLNDLSVYTLMGYDDSEQDWQKMMQASEPFTSVRQSTIVPYSKLLIVIHRENARTVEIELETIERSQKEVLADERKPSYIQLDFVPEVHSIRNSKRIFGAVDLIVTWPDLNSKFSKFELEWKLNDHRIDSFGRVKCSKPLALITLDRNAIYQLVVKAFAEGSSQASARSKGIIVETVTHDTFPPPASGSGCVEFNDLVTALFVLGSLLLVVMGILYAAKSKPKPATVPRPSFNKKASLKQQLSSMSARLAPGANRHSRLLEEVQVLP